MKKIILSVLTILTLSGGLQAQMFGTYNVPGTFPTLAAAVASLNAAGVGGPITINIAAGYTEVAPVGGYSLGVLTGASSVNTVTIRKSGAGANPVLSAYLGTATPASTLQDGVFRLIGTDWLTIDGIDIADGNTTNPGTMEFGYGFFKASATDGCQNNTIRNCVISLRTVNNVAGSGPAADGSRGIDVVNALSGAHTTAVTVTSANGGNSNNRFYSNVIQNCNIGVSMIGFAAASPFTLADTGNDIGGFSAATSNTIINFGGGGTAVGAAGINITAQHSVNIAFNFINNNTGAGVNHNQILRGIVLNSAATAQGAILNNTITLRSAGTTQQLAAISNAAGSSPSNTLVISNNLITGNQYATATSGVYNAIINTGTPSDLIINSNTITATIHSGTAGDVLIETGSPTSAVTNSNVITAFTRTGASGSVRFFKTTSPTTWIANFNLIDGASWTGSSTGTFSGLYSFNAAGNVSINNNILRNLSIPGSGTLEGIREFGGAGNKIIQNNQIFNFTTTAGGTAESAFVGISTSVGSVTISANQIYSLSITGGSSGSVNGILISGGTNASVFKNKIYDLGSTSTGPSVVGMNITGGTLNTIFNNVIGNLNVTAATGANAVIGINVNGGTTNQLYYNTVNLSSTSTGANFGSSALFAATTTSLDLRNNILVNNSSVSGTDLAVAFRRNGTNLTTYAAASNNNLFFAGTPVANRLVYSDGTNLLSGLANYKVLVFNRDLTSVTENPPFASTVGSTANFLNLLTNVPTQVQFGALPIVGITDDFNGTIRSTTLPDIGAYEDTYLPFAACSGAPASATAISTASLTCPNVPFVLSTGTTYTNSGITYQWQASTTGSAGVFSPVTGGTTAILSTPALTASAVWFQLDVTCVASGSVTTSAPVLVSVGFPTVNAVISSPTICGTSSVNLSLSGTPAGAAYQWMSSNTNSASGFAAIPNATLATSSNSAAAGQIWYQAVVSCSALPSVNFTTAPVTVSVGAVPSATVSGPTAQICVTSPADMAATTNFGTSFLWTGPNGYTANTASVSVGNAAPGVYSVVAISGNCASPAATLNLLVGGRNFTNNIVASTASVCNSGTVNLSFTNPIDPYSFSATNGLPLLTLTGANTVVPASSDDTPMAAAANIGFAFNFFGINYTQFSASPDGWLLLGGGVASSQFGNLVTSATNVPKIYPYWDDLATGSNGFVRTALLGATPNRTFVTEWFVTMPRATSGPANSTFQLLLFETTNRIQFRYGTLGNNTGSSSAGLTVNSTNYSSITFSSNTTSTATPNDNNLVMPASGQAYTFNAPLNPTYLWSPAANLSSTTASLVIGTVTASTVFSLDLNVQGCTQTKTIAITVNTAPALTLTASTPTVCPGTTASLTALGAGTYVWNTGATGSVAVVTPTAANVNTYTVTGTQGACSATQAISVSRTSGPALVINGPTGICPPDNATLTASGATSYTWSVGSNSATIVVTPSVPTQYTLSGTDAAGCVANLVRMLNVNSSLALNGTATSSVCAGQTATIAINGADTYSWSTTETTSSITPNPFVTTTYTVVGTAGSCTGSIAITVSAVPFPTVTVAGSTLICAGQTTTLSAIGASNYSWTTGSLNSSVTVAPATNTVYTVTGFNGVCASSRSISVTSNTVPVLAITQASSSVCFSTQATFTVAGANTYTWVNGPTTSTFVSTPTVATIYTVSGSNAAGCTASATVSQAIFALPSLVVTPATPTICQSTPNLFSATGAVTYTWNGNVAGSSVFLSATSNTVFSVTGTNANGCVNTSTFAVSTLTLPLISIAPLTATVCQLSPLSFTADGGVSYVWSNSASGNIGSFNPAATGTIAVAGTGTNGCAVTVTAAVTTLTLPIIAVTPSSLTVCAFSANNFTAAGATSYTWSTGANTSTTVITPSNSALYTVSGTNPEGCVSSTPLTVLTNPLPVITVAVPAPTVCANAAFNYTANGADTYTWSTGSNTNVTPITATATSVYSVSGTNTLTTCANTRTFVVATFSAPVISILPASNQSVCVGSAAVFTVSGANTFTWSNGGFGPVVSVTPSTTVTFSVTGKTAQNCSSTSTVSVGLFSLTVVDATASSSVICAKEAITFSATGATSYTWLPVNKFTPSFTLSANSTSKYTLIGLDANGCLGSDTVKVTVDKCTGLAESNMLFNMIRVFPNPSNGQFTIDMPFQGEKNITILSATGAKVAVLSTKDESQNMNMTDLAKGIYFIQVEAAGTVARYKVLVE